MRHRQPYRWRGILFGNTLTLSYERAGLLLETNGWSCTVPARSAMMERDDDAEAGCGKV